jgi:hypothetical protein
LKFSKSQRIGLFLVATEVAHPKEHSIMANIAQAFSRLLGSSKFWMAMVALAASILVVLNVSAQESSQIIAVITALSGVVILGIAIEDGGAKSNPNHADSDTGTAAALQPAPSTSSASPASAAAAVAIPVAKSLLLCLICAGLVGCATTGATTQPASANTTLVAITQGYDAALVGLTIAKQDGLLTAADVNNIAPALNAAEAALAQMQANGDSGSPSSILQDFEAAMAQLQPYLDKASAASAAKSGGATTQP